MKVIIPLILVAVSAVVLVVFFLPEPPDVERPAAQAITVQPAATQTFGSISPIQEVIGLDAGKVSLGEKLFNDPILSGNNTVSCATCHNLALGGSNQLPVSVGINGGMQKVNVPTVFNAGLNFKQFWDGRAETLEDQVDGPLQNPLEMGTNWPDAIARIEAHDEYPQLFKESYPEGISRVSISHAIAEFQRSLATPNSAFDRHLKGQENAMTEQALAGYALFEDLGCVRCHQGEGMGGNMFQRMGAKNEYFAGRDDLTTHDLGRFNVTGDEFDKHRFKVPSLRNVALTAPYFHDSSAATLEEAVQVMARHQLGRRLRDGEQDLLVAFLKSLTGEYQGKKLTLGNNDTQSEQASK